MKVKSLAKTHRDRKGASCYKSGASDPIEDLFDSIEMDIKRDSPDPDKCVIVSYDSKFGFPSLIQNTCMLDGDYPEKVWDFRPAK